MKNKKFVSLLLFVAFLTSWYGYTQDLDFNYEVSKTSCRWCKDGNIKVMLPDTLNNYTICIYNDFPYKNGELLMWKNSEYSKEVYFDGLKKDIYVVNVTLGLENIKGKMKIIKIVYK